ncbi:MAG TPA: hypothetical protein VIA18_15530, partial [Polyangia bacterium]|nr:hypothetical protein [Polyangia bacterium]
MRKALVVCVLAACAAPRVPVPRTASATTASAPPIVTSNILRRDYAGSQACAACHSDLYEKFMAAPMHNMTRLPSATTPMPPFTGAFKFKDDVVRFEQRGDDRLMHIEAQGQPLRTFKVTRVIGGHYREDFAGTEIDGRDPKSERILPASYFLATNTWRYKGYSVLGPERPGLRPGGVWNKTCIFCHNTIPYFDDILGAISDTRLGPYQGEVVDPLLPAARRATWKVTDPAALSSAVADEMGVLGARPQPANAGAGALLQAVRARFGAGQLIELGIGCESCHGGSLEHVKHNATKPSFTPRASFLRVSVPGKDERVSSINRACARCHQVLFTQYPWTWEGERRKGPAPGGSNINSGEAR